MKTIFPLHVKYVAHYSQTGKINKLTSFTPLLHSPQFLLHLPFRDYEKKIKSLDAQHSILVGQMEKLESELQAVTTNNENCKM